MFINSCLFFKMSCKLFDIITDVLLWTLLFASCLHKFNYFFLSEATIWGTAAKLYVFLSHTNSKYTIPMHFQWNVHLKSPSYKNSFITLHPLHNLIAQAMPCLHCAIIKSADHIALLGVLCGHLVQFFHAHRLIIKCYECSG